MSLISENFLLVSVYLVLYLGQLVHHLYRDWSSSSIYVPDLSSGLSFVWMVGFSLVHSLLGFLGCESWVDHPFYYISTVTGLRCA